MDVFQTSVASFHSLQGLVVFFFSIKVIKIIFKENGEIWEREEDVPRWNVTPMSRMFYHHCLTHLHPNWNWDLCSFDIRMTWNVTRAFQLISRPSLKVLKMLFHRAALIVCDCLLHSELFGSFRIECWTWELERESSHARPHDAEKLYRRRVE